jgi:CheY-like chemotaxis protein
MSVIENNGAARILYVEDDPPSGRLVKSIAETAGYAVDVVTTGSEFLTSLTTNKPDLLLVDLHLPDASGDGTPGEGASATAGVPCYRCDGFKCDRRCRESAQGRSNRLPDQTR